MILLREELGETLRDIRLKKGLTLRHTALKANVALSYLSELERGQKEASSEVILSITKALDFPLSEFLIEVANRMALFETITRKSPVPDTIPEEFFAEQE